MFRITQIFLIALIILIFPSITKASEPYWEVQSIDTMKYSRDLARERENDLEFEKVISSQVEKISETGATHVAIATPYDDEFIPFLKKWVNVARENELNIWFRGNFSGWEGWFGYESINRDEHIEKTNSFIKQNPEIFADGDIFTTCTECENGGPGDPRVTGDARGHRAFLINSYQAADEAFKGIGKDVSSNYFSMNGDVAYLIMDRKTTEKLGGIVVIDHYVQRPDMLAKDVKEIIERSGGRVVLGEHGAPIPDIHGAMTEYQQAFWIDNSLSELSNIEGLVGINYWTGFGGTTKIWSGDGSKRSAVDVLAGYYQPERLEGRVVNELGRPVKGASINANSKTAKTDRGGYFEILITPSTDEIKVSAKGYDQITVGEDNVLDPVVLTRSGDNIFFKMLKIIYNFFRWRV